MRERSRAAAAGVGAAAAGVGAAAAGVGAAATGVGAGRPRQARVWCKTTRMPAVEKEGERYFNIPSFGFNVWPK